MRKLPLAAAAAAAFLLALGASAAAFAQGDAPPKPAGSADAGSPPAKKAKAPKAAKPAAAPADGAAPAAGAAATPAAAPAAGAAAAPGAATAPAATDAKAKKGKGKSKKGKKGEPAAAPAPAPPPPTTVIIKSPPPPPPSAAPAPPPPEQLPSGPVDDELPTVAHTPLSKAVRGKPLVFTARMQDPSGIFQPVLYLRKRGTGDFIPIKMIGSKVTQGDYAVEVDAKLISVDLEYYLECWDNAGNGPARAGSPEQPFVIKLEEPPAPKVVIKQGEQPEEKKPAGAPPAISHSTVSKAFKGQAIEIAAKLVGDTGVSNAKVYFRHVGEKEFRELPMGNIGGDDFTATMPAGVVSGDLEYYLEAFDRYGNGPGRSGGPNVPYTITVAEKPPEPPPVITRQEEKGPAQPPPPPRPARPQLVKVPFKPNPGRWAGWLFMTGFVSTLTLAGGEAYGAWAADSVYEHTFNTDGRNLPALKQRADDYSKRAKIFGIAAAGSLVVGITLLLIFPEFPETQLVTGSGGDLVLARF